MHFKTAQNGNAGFLGFARRYLLRITERTFVCACVRKTMRGYANREILAELKIESVNIMVIRRHPSTVQNKNGKHVNNNKLSFYKSVLYTLGITQ